jgi:hypothetical protein
MRRLRISFPSFGTGMPSVRNMTSTIAILYHGLRTMMKMMKMKISRRVHLK